MASSKPPKTTIMEGLQRTRSEMPYHILTKEIIDHPSNTTTATINNLPTVSEIEVAKCECCGMSEECTTEYIKETKEKYSGRLICGLCGEAVKEEMEKNGGRSREEGLEVHMSACVRFNKLGRAYPALYQADNVRKILKKSATSTGVKSSSTSFRAGGGVITGGISRSSSCIPAITHDIKHK